MSARVALLALARGEMMAASVLEPCRLESGNVDAFGIEAISDAFRRAPMTELNAASIIEAPSQIMLLTQSEALFADLYDSRIGRLWRIGQPEPGTPEPAVGVAFDPDLRQARGDVFLDAQDHPAIDADGALRAADAARELLHRLATATYRARAFAIRAFGNDQCGAALFAVHALAANPVREPSLTLAAAAWDGGAYRIVRDPLRPSNARVRIVA